MAEETVVEVPVKPVPVAQEVFSREYVTELRNENKGYRLKATEMEGKAREAAEALTNATADADGKVTAAQQTANERILRAELKTVALKAGMVDLDGLKLADLSTVKLTDAGEVEGAEALMTLLKEKKPYLFAAASTTTQTNTPPTPKDLANKDARTLSSEDYKAQKAALIARK